MSTVDEQNISSSLYYLSGSLQYLMEDILLKYG